MMKCDDYSYKKIVGSYNSGSCIVFRLPNFVVKVFHGSRVAKKRESRLCWCDHHRDFQNSAIKLIFDT